MNPQPNGDEAPMPLASWGDLVDEEEQQAQLDEVAKQMENLSTTGGNPAEATDVDGTKIYSIPLDQRILSVVRFIFNAAQIPCLSKPLARVCVQIRHKEGFLSIKLIQHLPSTLSVTLRVLDCK